MAVKEGWRGRFFEDFEAGDVYEHPLGRTVTTTDNIWFTLLSQKHCPDQLLNLLKTTSLQWSLPRCASSGCFRRIRAAGRIRK